MAAASNPLQPATAVQPTSAPPSDTTLDKQRVTLILEINTHLLESIQALQASGKGGDVQSPSSGGADATSPTEPKKPSREYVESLRRMQANLAYLASLAERHQKPNQNPQPWPQVMTAPAGDEKLAAMYARLQGLFPMWRAHQQRMAAAVQAQQQAAGMGQQPQGNSMGGGMGQQNAGMVQQQQGGENMG